jgi:mRNA-degrading endonuclease RelE of RelBE toxin-antitoxin system
MRLYEIRRTKSFLKSFNKLSKTIQKKFNKQIQKLRIDPLGIGKPLHQNNCFRELKQRIHRVYYIVFEEKVTVILVESSKKKDQQNKINKIRKIFNLK